jgi:hypothetical protein
MDMIIIIILIVSPLKLLFWVKGKGKAVPLHAWRRLGGEEV